MNLSDIQKTDLMKMHEYYDNWPDSARKSYEQEYSLPELSNIDHIIFAGMGGSGTIGDVIASILSKLNIHVSVIKGYLLPKTVDENTVIIITSISGNTDETVRLLKNALKTNAKLITLSSGGKIQEISEKNKLNFYKIAQNHSPRVSLLGFLYSTLKILDDIIPINKFEINESLNSLDNYRNKIYSQNLTKSNPSLELAKSIIGIPVIYYPAGLKSAAIRFKNSLQENAKDFVIAEDVIEACHNGIVSWEIKQNMKPILIQGLDDHLKTKERWEILKEFFKEKNIEYYGIMTIDGSILSKLVCLIYQLDYASVYRAILKNVNPSPVEPIDYIKNRLGKNDLS
jgi:glucose/mannose-6-phosphate isomerase